MPFSLQRKTIHNRPYLSMKKSIVAALSCGSLLALSQAQAQTTITAWNFDNLPVGVNNSPTPSTGAGVATALGMNNSYNSTTSISTPDILANDATDSDPTSLNTWRVRGQNPGNGWSSQAPIATQGASFTASTAGYTGIHLSFDLETTKQAPANLAILYTLDGSTWTDVPNLSYASVAPATAAVLNNTTSANTISGLYLNFQNTAGGFYDDISVDFSGIAGANNNPNFGVEIVNASTGVDDINQSGAAYNNSSGNWLADSVVFSGTATVPEPSVLSLIGVGAAGLWQLRRRRQ